MQAFDGKGGWRNAAAGSPRPRSALGRATAGDHTFKIGCLHVLDVTSSSKKVDLPLVVVVDGPRGETCNGGVYV